MSSDRSSCSIIAAFPEILSELVKMMATVELRAPLLLRVSGSVAVLPLLHCLLQQPRHVLLEVLASNVLQAGKPLCLHNHLIRLVQLPPCVQQQRPLLFIADLQLPNSPFQPCSLIVELRRVLTCAF